MRRDTLQRGRNRDLRGPQVWESLGLDSMTCNLIYHHKDMTAAGDLPVATLSVPVAILVIAPISGVPIAISAGNISAVRMYSSPIGPTGMISTIGTTNGRTTFGVHRRAIIGLNRRASPIVGYFTVFPLISISVKTGG
jgi:hypothetical protein